MTPSVVDSKRSLPYAPLLVGGVTVCGLLLRAAAMNYSYGGDDFVVLRGLGNMPSDTVAWVARINYAPLYFIFLKLVTYVGHSEVLTRTLGVLFGTLSIPLLYLLAAKLFNPYVGLISAGMLAVSPFHIDQALQLKPATLLGFETLLSVYCLVCWIENRRLAWLVGCIVVNSLAIYTHYFAGFLILFENLAVLALTFGPRKRLAGREWMIWLAAQAGTVLVFGPWIGVVFDQVTSGRLTGYVPAISLRFALPELALTYTSGYTLIRFTEITVAKEIPWREAIANVPALLVWFVAFVPLTLLGCVRILQYRGKGYLLLLFLACMLGIPFAIALLPFSRVFSAKLTIGASLGYYVLLALGVAYCYRRRLGRVVIVFAVLVTGLSLFNFYFRDTEFGRRENLRGLVDFVAANYQKGDLLVVGAANLGVQYYLGSVPSDMSLVYLTPSGDISPQDLYARYLPGARRLWSAYRVRDDSENPASALSAQFTQSFRLEQELRFSPTLVLYLYEVKD